MLLDNIKSYETIDTQKPLTKQRVFGFNGMVKNLKMVEAGGVEPPSAT